MPGWQFLTVSFPTLPLRNFWSASISLGNLNNCSKTAIPPPPHYIAVQLEKFHTSLFPNFESDPEAVRKWLQVRPVVCNCCFYISANYISANTSCFLFDQVTKCFFSMKNRKASDTVPCNQRPGNVILAVECVVLERNVLSWSTRMK
jgi:hypothetical protein